MIRYLSIFCLLLLVCGGCVTEIPKSQVSLDTLISEYNTNAEAIPRVWAYADIEYIPIHDATGLAGVPISIEDGLLLLSKNPENAQGPHNFCLIGRETMSYEIFRVGVSVAQGKYYMWMRSPKKNAMWGKTQLAGAEGVKLLPIDPLGIVSILGVSLIPDDLTNLPAVTLEMDTIPGQFAYVLSYIDHQPINNKIGLRRKMYFTWSDSDARKLYKVDFIDNRGRMVMSANIDDYKPIDVSEMEDPPNLQPKMPTRFKIAWFNDRQQITNKVRIKLADMTAEKKWIVDACEMDIPSDIPQENIIQVDKDLRTDN